jgi:uncharacterized membrane protein (DUF2068 family)
MSEPRVRVAPWEDFVLRLIAVWKLCHAVFFTAVGFGLLKLRHHNVPQILWDYVVIPYRLNPENRFVDWILLQAGTVTPHALIFWGWVSFFYAALFYVEGIGLFLRRHWAEYLVVIISGSLLPLEIWEMTFGVKWWKIGVVVCNLLIIGYLVHRLVLDARFKAQQERELEEMSKKTVPSDKPEVSKVR